MKSVDVLIPTYNRPGALAVTLTSLVSQTFQDYRIVISDQSEEQPSYEDPLVQAVINVIRAHGNPVNTIYHLPRRGMAEQRHFLLSEVQAPYALFLDDDLILESYAVENLMRAIREEGCGFVGGALSGLSYLDDVRPEEQAIEFWEGPVQPERVTPDSEAWQRYRLHNAANLFHVQRRLGLSPAQPRKYKVAWVGGCVLFDTARLRSVGGFEFWEKLPRKHSGEDVLAQLRVMARYGGCGLIPSGVYHQELETTIPERLVDAPRELPLSIAEEAPLPEKPQTKLSTTPQGMTQPEAQPDFSTRALSTEQPRLPAIRKIAVLRSNALGDYIFVLPALEALRAAYPQAEIVYLGKDWHMDFLESRPGPVDRVVVVPESRGVTHQGPEEGDPQEQARFFERMVAERFDLAVQLHGGGRFSNPFLKKLGARYTAGLRTPDAEMLDRWVPYRYYQKEVFRYLEVVSLVGARPVTVEPRLAVTAEDRRAAEEALPDGGQPLVVLHPGASDGRRRWPVEKFARVGDALAAGGMQVAVTGVPPERPLVESILETMQAPALNLCGRLSLSGLVGLLERAALLVANDTGPLHLAESIGTPTVGFYWAGNMINAAPLTRSRNVPLVSWRLNCPVCGANTIHENCSHSASFVADIPVEAALEAIAGLFSNQKEPAGLKVDLPADFSELVLNP